MPAPKRAVIKKTTPSKGVGRIERMLEEVRAENAPSIDAVLSRVDALGTRIEELAARLANFARSVEQNSVDIRQTSADIRQYAADVRQNSAEIRDVKRIVEGIDKRSIQNKS
jgi:methyl-accepting chemotaxis protein